MEQLTWPRQNRQCYKNKAQPREGFTLKKIKETGQLNARGDPGWVRDKEKIEKTATKDIMGKLVKVTYRLYFR